jgi:hypothetical protein
MQCNTVGSAYSAGRATAVVTVTRVSAAGAWTHFDRFSLLVTVKLVCIACKELEVSIVRIGMRV